MSAESTSEEQVVRFVAYSDYLCPWCWNVSRRLQRLESEFEGLIEIEWRSYLLRPQEKKGRDLERFRSYTLTWSRPGAEPDAGEFRPWSSSDNTSDNTSSTSSPPSHSVPAHMVAKAAARVSPSAFGRMHRRLMEAYFSENRDISSTAVLEALWTELSLPADAFVFSAGFSETASDEMRSEIFRDFEEAREFGATGIPAIRRIDNDAAIVGGHPEELYRRWIERSLERGEGLAPSRRALRKE
ncbi:MAG: DsbA family protein [Myxococcota bacterium]